MTLSAMEMLVQSEVTSKLTIVSSSCMEVVSNLMAKSKEFRKLLTEPCCNGLSIDASSLASGYVAQLV